MTDIKHEKEETEQHLVTWFKTYEKKEKLHYYFGWNYSNFSQKKLEIKTKNTYLSSFCCHMVSFLLKTAIMQDSGCPYTSMKSGYEIVKKKYTIKFRLQQKISPKRKKN